MFISIWTIGIQAGTDLAGGYYGTVWACVGDHDYKRDCLLLPNINSAHPCGACPANTTDCPWFDFRKTARCFSRVFGHGGFDVSKCLLFGIIGLTHLSVYPDWMHDKPLGTDKV